MRPGRGVRARGVRSRLALSLALAAVFGCRSEPEKAALHLVDLFSDAVVEGTVPAPQEPARLEWSFEDEAEGPAADSPTRGWTAVHDVRGLAVREGRLVGRGGALPILSAPGPESPDASDFFHSLKLELRASEGTRLAVNFVSAEELDPERAVRDAKDSAFGAFNVDLRPGEELETYTITAADASFNTSYPLSSIRHVILRLVDAEGAEIEIASMRLVTLKEHLASIPSGIGWHGLDDVFRETIVSRSPERLTFDLDLPSDPWLELAVGTVENGPVTFRVEAGSGGGAPAELLRRTVSTPGRWHSVPVELGRLAGRRVALSLVIEAGADGTLGFWGTPVVRNRAGEPATGEPSRARRAVAGDRPPPRGVILVVADTLRRDHLPPWGYERENAPFLTRMAQEGAVFRDAIAQGAWTKVSVSSILSSLYPATHGVRDMPDRMPAEVTTLAEVYRTAGYATFATSSVPFTGRLTNLHQGVEVLHEATSIPDLDHSGSKTSRTYMDRLLEWVELHRDVPFFAFLHVFDPHSPFEPYRPYESLWMTPDEIAQHRRDMEKVREFVEHDIHKTEALGSPEELAGAGVDRERYLAAQKSWYDASIRAMDVEIFRLVERLDALGLGESTLIAFGSDHGEEFLEHGRPFHGHTAYGEMLNVPLLLWWPGAVPPGVRVERTVQNIDVMPTLLDLSRLSVPERAQGQSLLPLLAEARPEALGWEDRPAFAERAPAPIAFTSIESHLEYHAIVDAGWKLVRTIDPEGSAVLELFDHERDPLNLEDVAGEHPDVVERLAARLEAWHESALAARLDADGEAVEMSEEELEKLRALGYVN